MENTYLITKFIVLIGVAILVGQWIVITENSIEFVARQAPRVEIRTVEVCKGTPVREVVQTIDWTDVPLIRE